MGRESDEEEFLIMSNAKQYLEDIQGLLIYLKNKNGYAPSIKEVIEKQAKDPVFFKTIFDDYSQNHEVELKDYLIGRNLRIKETYENSLREVYVQCETATDEEFEKTLKETSEFHLNLISKLPTKFQELYSFATVHHLLTEIIEAASHLNYKINKYPIIGTVSNHSVNLGTFTLENGEPVIIVDEDFLSFIHLLSKIFVQCLPLGDKGETDSIITRKDEIIETIKNNPQILIYFKDFLKAYINGSPRKASQYFLPQDAKYMLCTFLMMSAEFFAIGHEIGHIIKHHDNSKLKFWYFGREGVTSFDEQNQEKEFEADKIGMHLAMQAMAKYDFQADFCYIGIECFFIVNDIALKAKNIVEKGHEDISGYFKTHPSNQKRKEKIRAELLQLLPEEDMKNATYLPDIIDETMAYLWENSKEDFIQEYTKSKPN